MAALYLRKLGKKKAKESYIKECFAVLMIHIGPTGGVKSAFSVTESMSTLGITFSCAPMEPKYQFLNYNSDHKDIYI